jgi:hypothetical protein
MVRLDHLYTGLQFIRYSGQILGTEQHFPLFAVAQEMKPQKHFPIKRGPEGPRWWIMPPPASRR